MATIYIPADAEAVAMMEELIEEHRQDLVKCDAKITLLFAFSDKEDKPALKHKGQRVAGSCRVWAYADKVDGKPDVTIKLDGERWKKWGDKKRRSLIHHELEHIALFMDEKFDDMSRPVLKSRHGDWEFDGFHSILELYGRDSFEYANLNTISLGQEQMSFTFGVDEDARPSKGNDWAPRSMSPTVASAN